MRTCLYEAHCALGAKIVNFAGWEMPVQYPSGILKEHAAVREKVGLFDVSHMGRIEVTGKESEAFLDYLSTNKVAGRAVGSVTYTVFANEKGGSVDDALIYRLDQEQFTVIVNAGNREKDLNHLKKYAPRFAVEVSPRYEGEGILALQGPEAPFLLEKLLPGVSALGRMKVSERVFEGSTLLVARSGYTGSDGFELCGPESAIKQLWGHLLSLGAVPIGLGARDTLRLEAGLALYGHELSEEISPLESISHWTVKADKNDFLGKAALDASPPQRHQYGAILREKGIAREGSPVVKEGKEIGFVTSGTFAPTLEKGIVIVMVKEQLKEGDRIELSVRGRHLKAEVVQLPFLKRER